MIKKINALRVRINKSKDSRTLASNFGYLILLQIAGYIFPLLTIPYLARVIGVEGFGKIAFASAIIAVFLTITDWGFNFTATRDVARNRTNLEKVSEIFSNVFWARIILMILSLLILVILIITIPYFKENKTIILVTFLLIPGHILFPDWFFQAMERMKYITIFNLISKAFFTVAVFIFINNKSDYILQPLIISIGYLFTGIGAMYIILVKWGVKISTPNWLIIFFTIKKSTDVFLNNIMPNLYNGFSTILVGFVSGSNSNGILDAGRKFSDISKSFIDLLSRVFYPYLSRRGDKHNTYAKINLLIALLFSIFLFITAPILINFFYTKDFSNSITVLKIMSLFVFFHALVNTYGVNYLIINGYEKEFRKITFLFSLIGFILLFPFVYFYNYIGAAIVVTLTRGLIGISVMIKSKKIINTHE